MRFPALFVFVFFCSSAGLLAQDSKQGPGSEKAQKSYAQGLQDLHDGKAEFALDEFKKADKQDGGHCLACEKHMVKYGMQFNDWKAAELASEEIIAGGQTPKETALAHYQYAFVLLSEGLHKHKDEYFSRSHDELGKALVAVSNFPDAVFLDG